MAILCIELTPVVGKNKFTTTIIVKKVNNNATIKIELF